MGTVARDIWTDERLDDLNHRVDEGFKEMKAEFRGVRSEMREEFGAVRSEMREEFGAVRSEMREEFGAVRGEIGGLRGELRDMRTEMAASRRTMVQAAAAIWVTSMVGFLGVIATIVASN